MQKGLSYSSYSALRRCGQYYKLSYIDRVPQEPSHALEFGSAMHAGLADVLETQDVESAQDVFEAYWDSVSGKVDDYERETPQTLKEKGLKFIARFHQRYGKDMTLVQSEKRLYVEHPSGLKLEGTPDAVVNWDGKLTLLDYKTSQYSYPDGKAFTSLQLHFYAYLLRMSGIEVEQLAYIVFEKYTGAVNKPVVIPLDLDKMNLMVEEMVSYTNRNQGHYEKNPNQCFFGKNKCPFFQNCWERK